MDRERIVEAIRKTGSVRGTVKELGGELPRTTLRDMLKRDAALQEEMQAARDGARNKITHADTTKNRYEYDEDENTFTFHLAARDTPYVIPGDTFEAIVFDYVKEGNNKTRGQISLEYNIPLPIMETIFRTYGLYKHSPPFTNEQFEEASDEDLLAMQEETIEKRKHRWQVEFQKRELNSLRKEVVTLREYKANKDSLVQKLEESTRSVLERVGPAQTRIPRYWHADDPVGLEVYDIHAPLADLHGGMYAWAEETWGGNYDTDIAAAIDIQHANEVAKFVKRIGGHCRELWATDIGDHFNGLDLETMHGTPQEQDGRAFRVWEVMFEAAVRKIDILRMVCDVLRVRFIPGNHDHIHVQHFFHSLKQRFYYAEDVEIVVHPRWQETFKVGRATHTLDHGQGFPRDVSSDKAISMAKRTIRNSAGEDYYDARFHYLYIGHLHNEARAEDDNIKVYRLPAAADQTDWENRNRWTAEPAARVWQLDEVGRPGLELPLYFRRDLD